MSFKIVHGPDLGFREILQIVKLQTTQKSAFLLAKTKTSVSKKVLRSENQNKVQKESAPPPAEPKK